MATSRFGGDRVAATAAENIGFDGDDEVAERRRRGGVAATTTSPAPRCRVRGSTARSVFFWCGGVISPSPLRRAPSRPRAGGRMGLVAVSQAKRPAADLVCAPRPCTQQIDTEGLGGYVRRENRKKDLIENRLAPIKLRLDMPFGVLKWLLRVF